MSHGFVLVKGNQHGIVILSTKFGRGIIPLNMLCRETFTLRVENKPVNPGRGRRTRVEGRRWWTRFMWLWLCTMPYRRWKKTLFDQEKNGSVENEKYMFISLCGLTTGIVRFHYWDYSCHTLETTPFPSSPATVSAGLFQYWSQQRRQ
jgi:hypothetical protein